MVFNLVVTVRDPVAGDVRDLKRQFDPTLSSAVLQQKWNNLGPAVLGLITDLLNAVNADPNVPPPL